MTFSSAAWRWAMLVLLCASWSGCSPSDESSLDEEKDPNYLAGKSRVSAMDYAGAVEAFDKALAANPHSGAAHLELGLIYQQNVTTNWARAIYHFEKYLELRSKASNADLIRQRILQCKLELAKEVPMATVNQQVQRELEKMDKLTRENADLRQQVDLLKLQLAQRTQATTNGLAGGPSNSSGAKVPWSAQVSSNAAVANSQSAERSVVSQLQRETLGASIAGKTHVIKSGDTPSSIARNYGVKVTSLLNANPGTDPKRLRPGQTLVIPST